MTGFRFALVLENGEPADPAVFATALPDWKAGDEFLISPEGERRERYGYAATIACGLDRVRDVRRGVPADASGRPLLPRRGAQTAGLQTPANG